MSQHQHRSERRLAGLPRKGNDRAADIWRVINAGNNLALPVSQDDRTSDQPAFGYDQIFFDERRDAIRTTRPAAAFGAGHARPPSSGSRVPSPRSSVFRDLACTSHCTVSRNLVANVVKVAAKRDADR